nr:unnamed protein product [Callosobruchus analis]
MANPQADILNDAERRAAGSANFQQQQTWLQKSDVDLSQANVLLEKSIIARIPKLLRRRKIKAIKLSADWRVKNKLTKITKKYFEELWEDERLSDGEARFRVNIFLACLDIICNQLLNRSKSLKNVIKTFQYSNLRN